MLKNFSEMEAYIRGCNNKKTIVVAGCDRIDILEAIIDAKNENLANFIMIGNKKKTLEIINQMGWELPDSMGLLNVPDGDAAVGLCCELVNSGNADIIMKGAMHTKQFMHTLLDKKYGVVQNGNILSQVTLFESPLTGNFMTMTDCAITIAPTFAEKIKILKNVVKMEHMLGNENPKVAVIAPIDMVNTSIQASVDAALIEKASCTGQIKGCICEGPMSIDVAVSSDYEPFKAVPSEVSGKADVLLMPDLCSANVMTRSFTSMFKVSTSGTVVGAKVPIIMMPLNIPQRDKRNSIMTAIYMSQIGNNK